MEIFKMDYKTVELVFLCFNILDAFKNGSELDLPQPLSEREEDKEEEKWPPVCPLQALSSAQRSVFPAQGSAEPELPRASPLICKFALSLYQSINIQLWHTMDIRAHWTDFFKTASLKIILNAS